MIDDEIDRRAHFVITETPSTVLHTEDPPTERAMAMSMLLLTCSLSLSPPPPCLSPCSARWQMAVGIDRDSRRGRAEQGREGQMPPGGPRARPVAHLCDYCAFMQPDWPGRTNKSSTRGYLTRLKKGGPKVKMHRIR